MKPELNCEYPDPDESKLVEEMLTLTKLRAEYIGAHRPPSDTGCPMRRQHAKSTGCVRGVFKVQDNLPDSLAHGVFGQAGKTYEAIVRFSNSADMPGQDGADNMVRGMAIKLLDVDGTPALSGASERCQDFLMVNHPVFPFATPAEYVKFFRVRHTLGEGEVAELAAVAATTFFHPWHALIIKQMLGKKVASPLEITYWSGSPYWLGPVGTTGGRMVKYSVVPKFTGTPVPEHPEKLDKDYLNTALKNHLKSREAVFDFRVQPQTDPVAMPVEDVSAEWKEEDSAPIPVATLTIPAQYVDSSEGEALNKQCDEMAFSPWNALAEHRPMGGINRMRKAVYLASKEARAAK